MFDESTPIPQRLNVLMTAAKPRSSFSAPRWCAAALALAAALGTASGQTSLVVASPFAPPGGQGGAAGAASPESYELAGSSVQGTDVLVCIYDRQAKRCEWIPVGGVANGIHVISYDTQRDKAVVTISGSRRELGLRKAEVVAQAPTRAAAASSPRPYSGPAPAAPAPPASAAAATHDQQEARMLVSDLLEIGVQQRKAYQEARQKAAAQPATPQPSN